MGKVTFSALPKGSSLMPNEWGFQVTIPLKADGKKLSITSIQVDFVKGDATQELTFNGNGTAFPALLEMQLVQAAMARTQ